MKANFTEPSLTDHPTFDALYGLSWQQSSRDLMRGTVVVTDRVCQPFGIVHGGVIATLLDTATFWAGFYVLPEDAGLVNVDLKLNYLKAVAGGRLVATGKCLRAGRQLSYTEASVTDEKGELVAHGTSTLMALPGKGLKLGVAKFLA